MASEGRIFKHNGVPFLVLKHGSNQQFSKTGALQVLSFDEYPLDLRPFLSLDPQVTYQPSDRYLHELFFPDLTRSWEQRNYKRLIAEGNGRLATPLYNLAFAALALAAVLGGSFSRLGYQTRIYVAAGAATVVRVLGFAIGAACEGEPRLNALQYALPLICFLVGMLIVLRQHPARGPKRAPTPSVQPAGASA
jgi:lipopolysaccharide export system permease protein